MKRIILSILFASLLIIGVTSVSANEKEATLTIDQPNSSFYILQDPGTGGGGGS